MFKQTLLFAILGAAIAAVSGTTAAQAPAKKPGAGLAPTCSANAPAREFLVVAGEWDTVPKDRDGKPAAYNDRGQARAANSKLERYTFDPSVIIVKRGDCVTLRIHDVKGSHHNVTIEGTEISTEGAAIIDDAGKVVGKAVARASPNRFEGPDKLKAGEFARGEEVAMKFQANQPGTYRMICEVHTFVGPKGELRGYDDKGKPVQGPMVAYITVLP
jgi:plastocyanin